VPNYGKIDWASVEVGRILSRNGVITRIGARLGGPWYSGAEFPAVKVARRKLQRPLRKHSSEGGRTNFCLRVIFDPPDSQISPLPGSFPKKAVKKLPGEVRLAADICAGVSRGGRRGKGGVRARTPQIAR